MTTCDVITKTYSIIINKIQTTDMDNFNNIMQGKFGDGQEEQQRAKISRRT
jgi:hypothetical protein